MRVRMALLDVMDVVRCDELQAELLRPLNKVPVDLGLFGDAVILEFEIKIVRAERLFEPVNRLARLGQLVAHDPIRYFAGETAGEGNQPVLVRGQQFLVYARLVIITGQMRLGGELDEVFIAGGVLRQQQQVMIHVASAAAGFLFQPAARRDIDFAADDGFDAFFAGSLIEINDAVHGAVVGDGQCGEFQFMGLVHQPVQPAGAVEQRILGVQVEMNKVRVRHGGSLAFQREDTKTQKALARISRISKGWKPERKWPGVSESSSATPGKRPEYFPSPGRGGRRLNHKSTQRSQVIFNRRYSPFLFRKRNSLNFFHRRHRPKYSINLGSMKLEDKLRSDVASKKLQRLPSALQGVTKERITEILQALDLASRDRVDTVFALLDDINPNLFFEAGQKGLKFCHGASTAHIACHVGVLQRSGGKLDREGRDYWLKPLWEIGALEKFYFDSETAGFLPGHPVPKSPNSAYRIAPAFLEILKAPDTKRAALLAAWASEDATRARLQVQAELAEATRAKIGTPHLELITAARQVYVAKFLAGFEIIYIDATDGKRVTPEQEQALQKAGIAIGLGDSMPDILLWNQRADTLWVIEAVTSDGEVDLHKVQNLTNLANRSGKKGIGFTTVYLTWKDAAARQGKHKNIAPWHPHLDSRRWLQTV